ncbi:MAG: nitroreductase [Vicinamibacterales bacterium]
MTIHPRVAVLRQLLTSRHSCRAFLSSPVPPTLVSRIVELAQRAPSWCNAQPWQLLVTSPEATERFRRALAAAAGRAPCPDLPFPAAYRGIYEERRRACGYQLYASLGLLEAGPEERRRQQRENLRFFGAPHVAIVTTEAALGVYGVLDCGAFIASFMLAAEGLGIATIAQASIAARSDVVRAHFALPSDRRVVCGISFGYEDSAHAANRFRTDRAHVREVLTWIE